MPKCIMPPAMGAASRISTSCPDAPGGRRPTGRQSRHDQDALRSAAFPFDVPAFLAARGAAIHGMDADGGIQAAAVAMRLTRVVADPAVYRRQRIVFDEFLPGRLEAAFLGEGEPGLDILARRTGMIAGRQQRDVEGALDTR
jgi:hypothetical protein